MRLYLQIPGMESLTRSGRQHHCFQFPVLHLSIASQEFFVRIDLADEITVKFLFSGSHNEVSLLSKRDQCFVGISSEAIQPARQRLLAIAALV